MQQPKIRLRGYNGAWMQTTWGTLTSDFKYGINAAAKLYDGKNKYLRITDIDDTTRVFLQDNLTTPDANLSSCEEYVMQNGDIVIARTGASVGKSYIYHKSDGRVYFAGFLIRMRLKDNVDKDFIFQNTLTESYAKHIRIVSQRSGQPGVNVDELKSYSLSMPTNKEEQQTLGSYFHHLDTLIQSTAKKIESLKQVKAASLQSMFPQDGETTPRVRFRGFGGEWEKVALGDIADIYQPQTIGADSFTEKGYDVYGANGIIGKYHKYNHTTNQSMIACRGSNCGVVNHSKGRCWINGNAMVINVDSYDINKLFMFVLLQKQNFSSIVSGSGQPQIVRGPLQQWNVFLPSEKKEQQAIADYFTALDSQISFQTQRLEKLKQIKSACLDNMFV